MNVLRAACDESGIDPWLLEHLACPVDRLPLAPLTATSLECSNGHSFPVIEGVPVLFHPTAPATFPVLEISRRLAEAQAGGAVVDPYFVESVGVNDLEKEKIRSLIVRGGKIDPVISVVVGATNGLMYKHLIGKLESYPIHEIRLPRANSNDSLLDVGCNWGRWAFSACRLGYRVVGIDPSLGSVMAARRAARALGLRPHLVVGDARHLPFVAETFTNVFSYSVIQHFSKEDARIALAEIGRVLRMGGTSLIQMPNVFGVRCFYHQLRRGFRLARQFEVRYWTPRELLSTLSQCIGKSDLSVDCFFGIGIQESDFALMPVKLRVVTRLSGVLRRLSQRLPFLAGFADSLYVQSIRE